MPFGPLAQGLSLQLSLGLKLLGGGAGERQQPATLGSRSLSTSTQAELKCQETLALNA